MTGGERRYDGRGSRYDGRGSKREGCLLRKSVLQIKRYAAVFDIACKT
jgi:hypothetical protein